MLSISKPLSPERASWYFKRDEYYISQEGEWYGKLADKLALSGQITQDNFRKILDGYDSNGEKLIASAGAKDIKDDNGNIKKQGHRAGIDLTFSAPKSVSILSYHDPRIDEHFKIALKKTLDNIQKEFAFTQRKDRSGMVHAEKTDNLLFATFLHDTSRELDPQLHCHCVLMNITEDSKGKTKTILNDAFYKNKMYIGQQFRNNLSVEMQNLGYQIDVSDRKKGFFEIRGVDENIMKVFSARSSQVREEMKKLRELEFKDLPISNLYEWAKERKSEHVNDPDFKQIIEVETQKMSQSTEKVYANFGDAELAAIAVTNRRRPKRDDVNREMIIKRTEDICRSNSTTLSEIYERAIHQTPDTASKIPVRELLSDAITGITDTQSTFTRYNVLTEAMKMGVGCTTVDDLSHEFNLMLGDESVSHLGTFETKSGMKEIYSSKEMIFVEHEVIGICKELKGQSSIYIDFKTTDDFIRKTDLNLKMRSVLALNESDEGKANFKFNALLTKVTDEKIAQSLIALRKEFIATGSIIDAENIPSLRVVFDEHGYGFTPGQKEALKLIASSKDVISVIQGDAGVGKSFSCLYAKQLLESNGFVVRGLAPTGKATSGLASAAEIGEGNYSTIDSFLLKYHNTDPAKRHELFQQGKEVWIVDEAGMCGSKKYLDIISVAKEVGAKVVFIGDRKQFQSIEAGRMFSELQDRSGVDKVVMPDVMRQKTAQTKEIVKAISLKDMDFAFNVMRGYKKVASSVDTADISNYTIGASVRFTDNYCGLSDSDECRIIRVGESVLTLEVFDEDTRANKVIEFNPSSKDAAAFDVYVPPQSSHPLSKYNINDNLILSMADQGIPDGVPLRVSEINKSSLNVTFVDPVSGSNVIATFDPVKIADNVKHLTASGNEKREVSDNYRNMITVDPEHEKCLKLAANDYLESTSAGKEVLLIAGTNKDKDALNATIRPELVKSGLVQNIGEFNVFQTRSISGTAAMAADNYHEGQVIITNKSCDKVPRGTQAEIVKRDLTKNTIQVKYWDKTIHGFRETEIDVRKNSKKFNMYDVKTEEYGVGDLVLFLKNDRKMIGVNNGDTARILSIDGSGNVKARLESTEDKKVVEFNIKNSGSRAYNFLSHAYCITDYKSQGATTGKLLWFAPTKSGQISSNAFYVAVTRCKEEVGVYTDNVDRLRELVKREQVKDSVLDYNQLSLPARGPVPAEDKNSKINVSPEESRQNSDENLKSIKNLFTEYFRLIFRPREEPVKDKEEIAIN